MGNRARAHNYFCVMPKVDPHFAFRHPANPAGNVITIIHSSQLGLLYSPVLSIHAYCNLTKSLKAFKGSFLSVVLSFRLYLVALCAFYKKRL